MRTLFWLGKVMSVERPVAAPERFTSTAGSALALGNTNSSIALYTSFNTPIFFLHHEKKDFACLLLVISHLVRIGTEIRIRSDPAIRIRDPNLSYQVA